MKQAMRILPLVVGIAMIGATAHAHGQFYKLKGGGLALGGDGQFSTIITSSPTTGTYAFPGGPGSLTEQVSKQQQYTTWSAGVLGQLFFHPAPWAGVEVNYGYTHYSERFGYSATSAASPAQINVPVGMHEATGAYTFHPKHIKFQPFVNIGGGAIYFSPLQNASQWRGAGLVESGFDIPTKSPHLAFRVQGRALVYRSPNFNTPALSTRSWRVTEEPTLSAVFRF